MNRPDYNVENCLNSPVSTRDVTTLVATNLLGGCIFYFLEANVICCSGLGA